MLIQTDAKLASSPIGFATLRDVLKDGIEQQCTERVPLLCSALQIERLAHSVRANSCRLPFIQSLEQLDVSIGDVLVM